MLTDKINYFYDRIFTMKRFLAIVLISMFAVMMFSGCQEANSSASDRKVKLVQNENFRLQNVIKEKDTEIASLEATIAKREKEIAKLKADAAMAAEKFIEILKKSQK